MRSNPNVKTGPELKFNYGVEKVEIRLRGQDGELQAPMIFVIGDVCFCAEGEHGHVNLHAGEEYDGLVIYHPPLAERQAGFSAPMAEQPVFADPTPVLPGLIGTEPAIPAPTVDGSGQDGPVGGLGEDQVDPFPPQQDWHDVGTPNRIRDRATGLYWFRADSIPHVWQIHPQAVWRIHRGLEYVCQNQVDRPNVKTPIELDPGLLPLDGENEHSVPEGFAQRVHELVHERGSSYGTPAENHQLTADIFSSWFSRRFGHAVTFSAEDVIVINVLQKMSRLAFKTKDDSWFDVLGYGENVAMLRPEQRNNS